VTEILNFTGTERGKQSFRIQTPGGKTEMHFVFLPGSQFHFYGFTLASEGRQA